MAVCEAVCEAGGVRATAARVALPSLCEHGVGRDGHGSAGGCGRGTFT